MMENVVPPGGQGAVEFDDSTEAGAVESRTSLVRALIEDIAHSNETAYTKQITVDDTLWTLEIRHTPK